MRKTVNRHQKEKHPSKKLDVYKFGCLCFEHKFDHSICQGKSPYNESLKCLMCDYSSDDKSLKLHTQRVHLLLRRYQCGQCDFRTFYSRPMKNHIISVHARAKEDSTVAPMLNLTCTLCEDEVDHEEHVYSKSENFIRMKQTYKRKYFI